MDNKGIRGEIAKYQRFQNNDALKNELTLKIVGTINAKECLECLMVELRYIWSNENICESGK